MNENLNDQAPQSETPRDQAPQSETPRDQAPQSETPRDQAPQSETPRDQAPQSEIPKAREVSRPRVEPKKRGLEPKKKGVRGFFLALLAFMLMVSCCGNFVFLSTLGPQQSRREKTALKERVYLEGTGAKRLLLIKVEGTILNSSAGFLGGPGVDIVKKLSDQLEYAADPDHNIQGLVLRINSPGGGVSESDQIYDKIEKFKATSKLPVIVSMGGLCASGGYYIAAAADQVFAEPTTITGSIGVILGGLNYSELLRKHGVYDVSITSGPNKAILNPQAPVKKQHLKILQATVDEMYERFVSLVAKGRGLSRETIAQKNIADGRIFTANQAKSLGLIDDIKYLEEVLEIARKRIGAGDAEIFELSAASNVFDVLAGRVEIRPPTIDPAKVFNPTPRLLYLWKP